MADSNNKPTAKNSWDKTKAEADFLKIFKFFGLEILSENEDSNSEENKKKFKRSKKDQNQLRGKCPFFCDTTTDERKNKDDFSLHLIDKKWQNFDKSCKCCFDYKNQKPLEAKGDVIGFVAFKEKITLSQGEKRVREIMQGQGGVSKLTMTQPQQEEVKKNNVFYKEEKPLSENKYAGKAPLELSQDEAELQQISVNLDVAKTFGIGFSSKKSTMRGRLLIPIKNSLGELMGYAGKGNDEIDENDGEWVYPSPKFFNPSLELFGIFEANSLYKTITQPRIFIGYDLLKVAELIRKHKLLALGILGNEISGVQIRTINTIEFYLKERFKEYPRLNKYPISEILILSDENEGRRQQLVNTMLIENYSVRAIPPK